MIQNCHQSYSSVYRKRDGAACPQWWAAELCIQQLDPHSLLNAILKLSVLWSKAPRRNDPLFFADDLGMPRRTTTTNVYSIYNKETHSSPGGLYSYKKKA